MPCGSGRSSRAQSRSPPSHPPSRPSSRPPPTHQQYVGRNITAPGTDDQQYSSGTQFKQRPGFNATGKAIQLALNAVPVTQFPNVNIFQYDVVIGNGSEKRPVIRKAWESETRKKATGPGIIFDGNKLAWSIKDLSEVRLMVDLDAEEGKPSSGDRNTFRVRIARTKKLDVSIIHSFLDGRISMDVGVLEAINFLDHLLREGPSLNPRLVAIKRSFFARDGQRADLGQGVEVYRGIYQSIRLAEGSKLVVNVDVANTCFWKPAALLTVMVQNKNLRDVSQLVSSMRPEQRNGSKKHNAFTRVLQGVFKSTTVTANYQGNPAAGKEWKIFEFDTATADDHKIEWKDLQTKKGTGQMVTITEYFRRKYNLRLQYPNLPLVNMTKKNVKYPMEFLHIVQNQRYSTKLSDTQTASMIKFAVSPPAKRLEAIEQGKSWLNWQGDQHLKNYGLKIGTDTIKTQARLLPPPGVKFGDKTEQPGTKGRWDLRGKKFLSANPQELAAWGVGMFGGKIRADKAAIDKFIADFSRAYRGHGGKVSNKPPHVMQLNSDAGIAVEQLHQATGNAYQRRPQLLIFLVQDKNSYHYQRIKKSADCRYGVVSQVMQLAQVVKGNPQYYSNVLMKVNAKLGGCTSQAIPNAASGFKSFGAPTMFIGADVSHASPGSQQPSMAAVTVSFDRHAGRYAAACQTNGVRVEMISENNMRNMLGPLITQWVQAVGGGGLPKQIYYMRDGVSEGQFAHVMHQEVPHIKAILNKIAGKPWDGKITVIVASKRHHVRAFPRPGDNSAGDQKGNPLPGCLIEHDVTSPKEWDFFMFSHIALQGTSRPVHYTVLHDDANHPANVLPNMIYEHCYQYMRSTTSVSLHPAVYYAHLASNRAKCHEDVPASEGPQGGAGYKQQNQPPSSDPPGSETKQLTEMYNANGIRWAMWYI